MRINDTGSSWRQYKVQEIASNNPCLNSRDYLPTLSSQALSCAHALATHPATTRALSVANKLGVFNPYASLLFSFHTTAPQPTHRLTPRFPVSPFPERQPNPCPQALESFPNPSMATSVSLRHHMAKEPRNMTPHTKCSLKIV
jgi:hypothetical protein